MQTDHAPRRIPPAEIIANPALFASVPALFADAWEELLAARGMAMHRDHIGPPTHRISRDPGDRLAVFARMTAPAAATPRRNQVLAALDAARPAIRRAVQAHNSGTPPTGGDAA